MCKDIKSDSHSVFDVFDHVVYIVSFQFLLYEYYKYLIILFIIGRHQ